MTKTEPNFHLLYRLTQVKSCTQQSGQDVQLVQPTVAIQYMCVRMSRVCIADYLHEHEEDSCMSWVTLMMCDEMLLITLQTFFPYRNKHPSTFCIFRLLLLFFRFLVPIIAPCGMTILSWNNTVWTELTDPKHEIGIPTNEISIT